MSISITCLLSFNSKMTLLTAVCRERVMGAQVGQVFQRLLTSAGAKFKMSASVQKATPSGKELPLLISLFHDFTARLTLRLLKNLIP